MSNDLKIIKEAFCYISIIWASLFIIVCLVYSLYIIALLWLLVVILFIPQIKSIITKHIPKIKKIFNIIRIIYLLITFIIFICALPNDFEGEWLSDNNINITLNNDKAIITVDNNNYYGTYNYESKNNNKIIKVKTDNKTYTFNYYNNDNIIRFCLIDNNKCKIYFTPKEKQTSYTYINSNNAYLMLNKETEKENKTTNKEVKPKNKISDSKTTKKTKSKEVKLPTCDGKKVTSNCVIDGVEYLTYKYYPATPEKSHTETRVTYTEEITGYCTKCNDGTYSPTCATGRGACSHHGGVAEWNSPIYSSVPHYEEIKVVDSAAIPEKWEKIKK